jgi:hypothetical protein
MVSSLTEVLRDESGEFLGFGRNVLDVLSLNHDSHERFCAGRSDEYSAFFTQLFADADVRKIVAAMARSNSSAKILDIVIPSRIITIMLEHSKSDATLEECCEIYLKEYLENSEVLNLEKYWI